MNYSKYRFNLDMQSYISQISLPVRQHDTGIVLRINLTDGGVPYVIRDGCRAIFYARKSDGNPLMNDCVIEKNTTICYELTPQTTSCSGVVDCEVRLYGTDGNLITTPRFILVVDSRVVHDEDFPLSESEQNILDNIIRSETVRQENEVEREETHKRMLATTEEASQLAATLRQKLDTGDYDGVTPHVGANGNWWFEDEDTGILARGVTPHIGSNRNWWFNDVDTGVQADAGNHTHSTDAITKGLLPLSRGGTGAGDKVNALKNLGGITEAEATAIADAFFSGALKMARGVVNAIETQYPSNAPNGLSGQFTYAFEINFDIKPCFIVFISEGGDTLNKMETVLYLEGKATDIRYDLSMFVDYIEETGTSLKFYGIGNLGEWRYVAFY